MENIVNIINILKNSKIKIKNKKYIILLLALLGIAISIELSYIFYKSNFIPDSDPSFCTISQIIDCDAVAKTAFASFLGVPLALWGLGFYIFVLFLNIFPFQRLDFFRNFKNPNGYIFLLSSIASVGSIILWIISSLVLHKICILCYMLYAINFAVFFLSKEQKPLKEQYRKILLEIKNIFSEKRWIFTGIALLVIFVAGVAAVNITSVFVPPKPWDLPNGNVYSLRNYYNAKGNILGAKKPKITINIYTDFECSFCSIAMSNMYRLISEVDGVRIEHHDFPLNSDCNQLVGEQLHKNACITSYYSIAAAKQGKYWDFATLIYDNQQNLSEQRLIELARSLNMDIWKLKKDAYSEETKKHLQTDIEKARQHGINATPTYFIGIKKYAGVIPYPDLKAIVLSNLE